MNLEELKQKIFFEKKREHNYIDTWNYLMLHYGYIPLDDFLSLDCKIVDELVEKLNELNKNKKK